MYRPLRLRGMEYKVLISIFTSIEKVLMKAVDINVNLIERYLEMLNNLSPDSKLELIARLSKSMKTKKEVKSSSLEELYGSFISEQSADELIDDLKKARTFNRKRADL